MSSRGAVGVGGAAGAAFAALTVALDQVGDLDWWRCSDAELAELVRACARAESRCAAAGVAVLAEASGRGLPAEAGARDGAGWFRGLVPVTPAAARARAGLAQAFGTAAKPNPDLAPTREAFAAGDISLGHAGVLARTVEAVAGMPEVDEQTRSEGQALLLATAEHVDPAQLGRAGLRLRHRLDPDAAERLAADEDAQGERRDGYLVQDWSGMWVLHGVLPAVAGATLKAALDPLAAPRPATDGSPDPRSGGMRFADAVTALAELSLAARGDDRCALPSRGGAATRLVLTAELATLQAASATGLAGLVPPVLSTGEPGGWEVSPLTLDVLSCDAEVIPVLTDGFGRALDVGDTIYPFPARIRRAVEVRDLHCTFPGCSARPAWCHVHHLTAFGKGGPTAERNGALLCGRHHRYVHAHHWTGQLVDGHVVWRAPDEGEEQFCNARIQAFERALRDLAQRWRHRNPHLQPAHPPDTG